MKNLHRHRLFIMSLLAVCSLFSISGLDAREFRGISGITSPNNPLPTGATRPQTLEPIDLKVVEQAVYELVKAWNGGGLSELISNDFANVQQLLLVITKDVPRDAKMRVLSIQGIQTLDQYQQDVTGGKDRISIVTATAKTAIEFTDSVKGFQRLEGVNEFQFRVIEQFR